MCVRVCVRLYLLQTKEDSEDRLVKGSTAPDRFSLSLKIESVFYETSKLRRIMRETIVKEVYLQICM